MYILNKLKIFSSFLVLIMMISFMLLANWQYNKYTYKMYADIFSYNLKNKDFLLFINQDNNKQNNEKKIKIRVDCSHQNNFLLENQVLNKSIGYNLYTCCKVENLQYFIFVSRGWISKNQFNKIKNLPVLFNISAFNYNPVLPFEISRYSNQIKNVNSIAFFQRIGNLIVKNFIGEYKYFTLSLGKDNKYKYNMIKKNVNKIKPIRHFFYALQWLFFSLTLFFYFILYKRYILIKDKNAKI